MPADLQSPPDGIAHAVAHDEAFAAGKAARRSSPRSAHAAYDPADRLDPLSILETQNADRLPDLVPLRLERMLATPFAFYRGTAAIMAADLARGVSTDIDVVACGDAHIANFGLFASPQRTLVFDLNDFDEATTAPWEWDVKRLVTSVVIGGRDAGHSEREVRRSARHTARAYREAMHDMMALTTLERYYRRADTDTIRAGLESRSQRVLDRAVRRAKKRTSQAFVDKVTERGPDGIRRIVEDPPVLAHVSSEQEALVDDLFALYRSTVPSDVAVLLSQFRLSDVVRRVVGVGSVGTRCFLLLLDGPKHETMVLQIKEAPPSVLVTWGGQPAPALPAPIRGPEFAGHEGFRVVAAQRILQAVSDPFLGYFSSNGRHFYVRQFRDLKGSIETDRLGAAEFLTYVDGCATLLARAHAQSPNAAMIAGYLGHSDVFDRAVTEWSLAYAEQSRADFDALHTHFG